MNNNLTEVVFVIDRSGSMWPLVNDTLGGFNSMLEKQKNGEGECYVSTVLFNHQSSVLYDRVPIGMARPMEKKDYCPSGSTALYDALGDAIHHIGLVHKYAREEDRPAKTIFIITTDGMENASRRYTEGKLKELIEEKKAKGWEFLFLASDLGALEQAKDIGIPEERISVSCEVDEGTQVLYACCNSVISDVRKSKKIKKDWNQEILEHMEKVQKKGEV